MTPGILTAWLNVEILQACMGNKRRTRTNRSLLLIYILKEFVVMALHHGQEGRSPNRVAARTAPLNSTLCT